MATKKRDFGSAADAFLNVSLPTQATPVEIAEAKPAEVEVEQVPVKTATVKRTRTGKEVKSKKVLLYLTPSLYEKIKSASDERGLSFNACVTMLLTEAIK